MTDEPIPEAGRMSVSPDERIARLEETLRRVVFLQGELAMVLAHMRREIAHLKPGGNPMNIGVVAILREEEISQILRDAVVFASSNAGAK